MSRMIETQMYPLAFLLNQSPQQFVNIQVPFIVKKIVFKPISIMVLPDQKTVDLPTIIYSDIYDVTKPIGYAGYYNSFTTPGVYTNVVYVQPAHDITFTPQRPKELNSNFRFWIGDAFELQAYQVSPFTGTVMVTVEYHSEV
jgi:hypothetical protein